MRLLDGCNNGLESRPGLHVPLSILLRLVGGGALLLAGVLKLQSGPGLFMKSIESFRLLPEFLLPVVAHTLPWLEVVAGGALLLGLFTRESALVCAGLYAAFTFGILSAIARGLKMDCGCFGDLFGAGEIGWHTVARNVIFLTATLLALLMRRHPVSLDAWMDQPGRKEANSGSAAEAKA